MRHAASRVVGLALLLAGLVTAASSHAAPAPAASRDAGLDPRWYAPLVVGSRAFPVLLPADFRWLNWRDTYGAPRMRFENGVWKQTGVHQGIDVFAEKGSPIVAVAPGTVENAGWTFYSGWRVGIRGSDRRYYFYAHLMRRFAPGIGVGASVGAGEVIGYLGNSGYGPEGTDDEFPPHLHFGLQTPGGWVNPQQMLIDLYSRTVSELRNRRRELRSIDVRIQGLRAAAAASPAPPDAAGELASLERRRRELESSLIYVPQRA